MEKSSLFDIIVGLLPKNNKRYTIFAVLVLMCIIRLVYVFIGSYGGIYGGTNIFEWMDITGGGELTQCLIVVIFTLVSIYSVFVCFKTPIVGVDRKKNKILAVAFIFIAILSCVFYGVIRGEEEKKSQDFMEKRNEIIQQSVTGKKYKNSTIQKLLLEMNLQDESREYEIFEEMENDFSTKLLDDYFWGYQSYFFPLRTELSYDLELKVVYYYSLYFIVVELSLIYAGFFAFESRRI